MNIDKAMKLIEKYVNCSKCGSDLIGNGEGILEVQEDTFKRTCKCGWLVEVGGVK